MQTSSNLLQQWHSIVYNDAHIYMHTKCNLDNHPKTCSKSVNHVQTLFSRNIVIWFMLCFRYFFHFAMCRCIRPCWSSNKVKILCNKNCFDDWINILNCDNSKFSGLMMYRHKRWAVFLFLCLFALCTCNLWINIIKHWFSFYYLLIIW